MTTDFMPLIKKCNLINNVGVGYIFVDENMCLMQNGKKDYRLIVIPAITFLMAIG